MMFMFSPGTLVHSIYSCCDQGETVWLTNSEPSPGLGLFVFSLDYLKIGLKVDLSISAAAYSASVRLN